MAVFADGKIEVYLGPSELNAADNLEQVIVEFIMGARRSREIAVQELDSEPIAQAILDARWRGVRRRPLPLPGRYFLVRRVLAPLWRRYMQAGVEAAARVAEARASAPHTEARVAR